MVERRDQHRRVPRRVAMEARREKQPGGREFESHPRPPFKIRWRERVSNHKDECHYLTRWTFETPWFSVRLHHWLSSDDARFPHDHPWWFVSLVLLGSYIENTWINPAWRSRKRRWLSCRWYPHHHSHCVVVEKPCWTLMLTGPASHRWGFWVGKTHVTKRLYFKLMGHHQCD